MNAYEVFFNINYLLVLTLFLLRKKVIKERHKRWGTPSPWLAEFWCNAVAYCKTPEGNERLESWLVFAIVTESPVLDRRFAF